MKTYKLIQKYPGSPSKGSIIERDTDDYDSDYYWYSPKEASDRRFHRRIIENYPKFWKKIKSK